MRQESSFYDSYNAVAKFLHWAIAFLIIINYIMGLTLDSTKWYIPHKQIGLMILVLALLRVIWRLINKYPSKLSSVSTSEQFAAQIGQLLLYLLMLAIPISGILMVQSFGYPLAFLELIPLPTFIVKAPDTGAILAKWHLWMAHTVIIIAAGHALIALAHHYVLKDRLLQRMLPDVCNKKSSAN